MKPMTVLSFILGLALMLPGSSIANDATSSAPPSVTMESAGGGIPAPPVCNTFSNKLHWTGTVWQCIADQGSSTFGKGGVVSVTTSGCPSGTVRYQIRAASSTQSCQMTCTWTTIPALYMCVKS